MASLSPEVPDLLRPTMRFKLQVSKTWESKDQTELEYTGSNMGRRESFWVATTSSRRKAKHLQRAWCRLCRQVYVSGSCWAVRMPGRAENSSNCRNKRGRRQQQQQQPEKQWR